MQKIISQMNSEKDGNKLRWEGPILLTCSNSLFPFLFHQFSHKSCKTFSRSSHPQGPTRPFAHSLSFLPSTSVLLGFFICFSSIRSPSAQTPPFLVLLGQSGHLFSNMLIWAGCCCCCFSIHPLPLTLLRCEKRYPGVTCVREMGNESGNTLLYTT